ncbi:MAG: TOBE domain-containing protein [Methanobrevibacter sp.]|jgi:molybdopterin-binding protein|nr:TOBE domain-containing protein [Candidatus Methanovirga basalitermitum]
MQLSARNIIDGKVSDVELGAVMAKVKIEVSKPGIITALVSKEAIEDLNVKKGDDISAIIKSTEIIIAKK